MSFEYRATFVIPKGSFLAEDGHSTGQPPGFHRHHPSTGGQLGKSSVILEFDKKTVTFDIPDPLHGKTFTWHELNRSTAALHVWRTLWEADFARHAGRFRLGGKPVASKENYTLEARYILPEDAGLSVGGCDAAALIKDSSTKAHVFDVRKTSTLDEAGIAEQDAEASCHAAIHALWVIQCARYLGNIDMIPYP